MHGGRAQRKAVSVTVVPGEKDQDVERPGAARRGDLANSAAQDAFTGQPDCYAAKGSGYPSAQVGGQGPQESGERVCQEQERRRDHHQQQVLHHVDGKQLTAQNVDRRDERQSQNQDAARVGCQPPTVGEAAVAAPPQSQPTDKMEAASKTSGARISKRRSQDCRSALVSGFILLSYSEAVAQITVQRLRRNRLYESRCGIPSISGPNQWLFRSDRWPDRRRSRPDLHSASRWRRLPHPNVVRRRSGPCAPTTRR